MTIPEKQVRLEGLPPMPPPLADPRAEESASDNEREHADIYDGDGDAHDHDHEHSHDAADPDEGIDELMDAFADDEMDIDLTHLRLHSTRRLNLPRFARTLERLVLRQNQITKIRRSDFEPMTELRELDFYDNLIEHIGGLDNCTKLEYVAADQNS